MVKIASGWMDRVCSSKRPIKQRLFPAPFGKGFCFAGLLALIVMSSSSRTEAQISLFKIDGQPLVLSGAMRTRDYLWSFFNPGPVRGALYENQYNYGANVLRLALGYQTRGVKIFTEMMNPLLLGLPDHALAPHPQGALGLGGNYDQANRKRYGSSILLKQAFAEFHGGSQEGFGVKGDRFEFSEGIDLVPRDPQLRWIAANEIQQRLIGNFGWSDVMRSLDGGMVRYGDSSWNLTALAAVPTQGVFAGLSSFFYDSQPSRSSSCKFGGCSAGGLGLH
ncbi:MAG: hypothetical protein ACRD2G_13745, partial [Terriglobia bacterium]